MTILITGGCGFIGTNFIFEWLQHSQERIINLDKLTYAGNAQNLLALKNDPRHLFIHGDISDRALVSTLLSTHQPRAVINFAAESHVDRSIHTPDIFMQTNVLGTFNLLECVKYYWQNLTEKNSFRFLHISTDEVYGSLSKNAPAFTELNRYAPNSPYAASKAASDHLVRAYQHTYDLPTLTTNCSNNYGPFQFPEKFIPLMVHHALTEKSLPVYGDGLNIRDWLYVVDHCAAIRIVLEKGKIGEVYNIGGSNEKNNLEVVHVICEILDKLSPRADGYSYKKQITFVKDRAGHDKRYAIDSTKIQSELGWQPAIKNFETGLQQTIEWYLNHSSWVNNIINGDYKTWIEKQYA